ncbi:MAG: hypothetical protein P8X67_15475 [Syntrophobacterales bacterium]|jgi:hypothetical protein
MIVIGYLILSFALCLFLLLTGVFTRLPWTDSEAVEIDLLYVETQLQEEVISESFEATV